jgi:polyisoprenoid-binding protein YceI
MSSVIHPPAGIPAGTWAIDPAHSTIEFVLRRVGFPAVRGEARAFGGVLTGGSHPSGAIVVRADSLATPAGDALSIPDVLDSRRHPFLRFDLWDVTPTARGLVLDGHLTVRGCTRRTHLHARLRRVGPDPSAGYVRLGLDITTAIDRRDYGLVAGGPAPDGDPALAAGVWLTARLCTVREA